MQPKIYEVYAIRKVNVRELYQVISKDDRPTALLKLIVEDKIPAVDLSQVVLGYDDAIKVDKVQLQDKRQQKINQFRNKGLRDTQRRLNQILLKEKETNK